MNIRGSVAFVTGANRGLGLAIAQALLDAGARKVYAGARNPEQIELPGVVPIRLDVTDAGQVAAAAAQCQDTQLLVNNAGIGGSMGFLSGETIETARRIFETNYYGLIRMSQAFAPVLAANGGGAVANILSVAAWTATDRIGVYASSKAAAWSFTNVLRTQLRAQQTLVVGLHAGFIDTGLARQVEAHKSQPDDVARQLLEAIEAGREEVLADRKSRLVKQGLSAEPGVYLAPFPD
ncbi:MAG TPA: SDR family oxidoreductase [Burkholderiaceae bacterium]|nr:SDR family oxidoreductase [Burkholderiaceae bacterium]